MASWEAWASTDSPLDMLCSLTQLQNNTKKEEKKNTTVSKATGWGAIRFALSPQSLVSDELSFQ